MPLEPLLTNALLPEATTHSGRAAEPMPLTAFTSAVPTRLRPFDASTGGDLATGGQGLGEGVARQAGKRGEAGAGGEGEGNREADLPVARGGSTAAQGG